MRRKLLIVLLSLGTVIGYGAAFARMRCGHGGWHQRRAMFERHVADICTDAALKAHAERASASAP